MRRNPTSASAETAPPASLSKFFLNDYSDSVENHTLSISRALCQLFFESQAITVIGIISTHSYCLIYALMRPANLNPILIVRFSFDFNGTAHCEGMIATLSHFVMFLQCPMRLIMLSIL